jgi:hypothetical protein
LFLILIKTKMKNLFKLLIAAIMFTSLGTTAFAQVTASATASATVITPIALTKDVDMNFGNVAVIGAGTVILAPAGTRTKTGGVTLPVATGTVSSASFTVGGEGASTYAITLPTADYTITKVASTETMIVNTFTSTPSGTGALTAGAQTLTVGATLNVGAAQVSGSYTNIVGFDVTVNYN